MPMPSPKEKRKNLRWLCQVPKNAKDLNKNLIDIQPKTEKQIGAGAPRNVLQYCIGGLN